MSLFQLQQAGTNWYLTIKFTFQYVSISMRFKRNLRRHSVIFTFQYVSISIVTKEYPAAWYSIYIPICLYFNHLTFNNITDVENIYIPICLYFNEPYKPEDTEVMPIYIPICLYFNCTILQTLSCVPLTFTFQYVSISISPTSSSPQISRNLHSNMSLFQCTLVNIVNIGIQYLHSNMSLFQYISTD